MKNAGNLGSKINIFAQPTNNQNSNNSSSSMLVSISQSGPSAYNSSAAAVVGSLVQSLVEQKSNIVNELPTDESIAYDDPDINQRYIELQKLLLNPLRTEIISIAEYIPLSSGDSLSEDSASINLNLGAQSKITVTNVARLIELHRQIREYTTNSATVLFQTLYPVKSSEDFLQYLKKATNDNIESASQFSALDVANNTNRVKKTIDAIIQTIKDGYTGGFEASPSYISMIKEKDNDAFMRGLIEYFIYEIIILDIIKFIGGISTIREKLNDNWQIDKCLQSNPFNPNTAIRNQNISLAFQNSNLALNEPSNIDKKIIGTKRTASDSDYDMIFNLFANICSLVLHKDSITFLESYRQSNRSIPRNAGEIKFGLKGDLGRLIKKIKNINQVSLLNGVPAHTRLDRGTLDVPFNSDSYLFNYYKDSIYDFDGDAPSGNQIISEILSAIMFDLSSFEINKKFLLDSEGTFKGKLNYAIPSESSRTAFHGVTFLQDRLNFRVHNLKIGSGPEPESENSYTLEKVTLQNKGIPEKGQTLDAYEIGNNKLGNLLESFGYTLNRERNDEVVRSEGDTFFLPLESTKNETLIGSNIDNESYNTGPEYYFDKNITKNNISFTEMDNFSKDYKNKINSFLEDFFTFFPDHDIAKNTPAGNLGDIVGKNHNPLKLAINLLEKFANKDIERIKSDCTSSTNSCIPILSTWLNSPYESSQVDVLQGVYWTYAAMSKMPRIDNDLKDTDEYGPFNSITDNSQSKDIGKLMGEFIECFNEKVSQKFLEKLFGQMDSGAVGNRYWQTSASTSGRYKSWMGENGNPYSSGQIGDAQLSNHDINTGSGKNKAYGGNIVTWETTRNNIDNDFDACFSGKEDRLKNNNSLGSGGKYIDFNDAPGFAKLISTSLRYIGELDYTSSSEDNCASKSWLVPGNTKQRLTMTYSYANDLGGSNRYINYKWNDNPVSIGGIYGFGAHQRVLTWFWWVNSLFRSCITIKAKTFAGDKNKRDKFKLSIDLDQLSGIKKGILDAILVIENGSQATPSFPSDAYKEAYEEARKRSITFLNTIKKRQDYIKECLGLLAAHADSLSKTTNEIKNVIQGNDNDSTQSNKRKMSKSVISSQGVDPRDILPLITNYSPSTMYEGYNKYFRRLDNTMFSTDINYSLVKNKFIYKILSEPGYGFLTNEKRGNKSVINVGIPLSMISSLQKRAFKETKNPNFKYSPYVSISIYKKDHLNDEIVLLPKSYVFDTSATIQDYKIVNNQRKLTNHLLNFDGDKSFDNILKTIEVTRISTNYIDNTTKIKNSIGYPAGIFNKDVMINHVVDYCLKEYSMLTTGLDYSQHSFLLKSDAINLNKVNPSPGVGSDLVTEFETIITKINQIYPETINDPQLANEVFRLVRILKNSIPFNIKNRLNKVLYPTAFDRIYSIFVNEKDFVLANDLNSIFTNGLFENNAQPAFKATSKLSRPDITTSSLVNNPYAGGVYDRSILKYAKSCKENYPEVYNYYAIVSLLPLNFVEGAEDKFMSDESIISLASATPVVASQVGVPSGLGFKP